MEILSSLFLIGGASLCLIAAIGVLRLPDFFMRMHAATKAGVAGCGLVLVGVALSEQSGSTWIKVFIAVTFLLLTTPLSGHLLGRAGYVSGVPLWRNTVKDDLVGVLPRGDFDEVKELGRTIKMTRKIDQVILGVAAGDGFEDALRTSLSIAQEHKVRLKALAIIDTARLHKVGPVPVGGNFYAKQLRNELTARARRKVADAIEAFERAAVQHGVEFSVKMEEGNPEPLLRLEVGSDAVLVLPRNSWFDQGLAMTKVDPTLMLKRYGIGRNPVETSDSGPIVLYV